VCVNTRPQWSLTLKLTFYIV